jgi:hypothetical protein
MTGGSLATVFTRADFEERVERVRRRALLYHVFAMMMLAVGYPAVFALDAYRVLPSSITRPLLIVPIVAFGVSWALASMALPRLIRRMGLHCPICDYALWHTGLGRPGRHAVLETGKCPKCNADVLDVGEAGARPAAPISLRDHIQEASIVVMLVIGLAAFVYFGKKSRVQGRTETCAARYAAAKTAADSVRVDQSGFRRSSSTCEDYQR